MMIRYIHCFIIAMLIMCFQQVEAQKYGNEWIKSGQTYWKIPLTQKGIYRITYGELQAIGFPLTTIHPKDIQLFHRGKEQAILVTGQDDARFDPSDYIEFYGKGNDGMSDVELYYPNYSNHLNPYYNIYSDTTAYFLTIQNGVSGKRMETVSLNSTGLTAQTHHEQEELIALSEVYSSGRNLFNTSYYFLLANYDEGEGYTSDPIYAGQSRTFNFQISDLKTGTTPTLEFSIVGRTHGVPVANIEVGSTNRSVWVESMQGYRPQKLSLNLSASDFPSPSGNFSVRLRNTGPSGTAFSVTYLRVKYAQGFNANNQEKVFNLLADPEGTSLVNITNVPANARVFDITAQEDIKLIKTTITGGNMEMVVANTALISRKLYLNSQYKSVIGIQQVNFELFNPAIYNYLIVYHKSLSKSAGKYTDPIQAYVEYRSSEAGGRYKPLAMEINQLYNQFNYGETSPMAIRRFAQYLYDNGTPQFLFLIGYSITIRGHNGNFGYSPDYNTSLDIRKNPREAALNLVPTFGHPGSDAPFTAGFDQRYFYAPSIATGRLIADKAEKVATYLDKVKEHEAGFNKDIWRKNIIHLSGGTSAAEQITLRNNLKEDHEPFVVQGLIGGNVRAISKTTTENVEYINLADQINNGVSLVTFFGHSGVGITDIDIGQASDPSQGYNNTGRYPMILANGCSIGEVYSGKPTLAENWLFTPNKGAIAWHAGTWLGFIGSLNDYSSRFYKFAFDTKETVGQPLGVIQQKTLQDYGTSPSAGNLNFAHAQLTALQGDPAVKISPGNLPDYYIQNAWLSIEPFQGTILSAQADSLQLRLIVANLGIVSKQPLSISVTHTLNSGIVISHTPTNPFEPIKFLDTLTITLPRPQGASFAGNNRIEVKLDYIDSIQEINELNNTGFIEFLVPDLGVKPLFPLEYSIVNSSKIQLLAQSGSLLANTNSEYVFELDTSATFNSPLKKTNLVAMGSTTPSWQVELPYLQDSTVYYWRVNLANGINNPNILWGESSFIYINNSPQGWAQARFPQFSKASKESLLENELQKKWEFDKVTNTLKVITYGDSHPQAVSSNYLNTEFQINGRNIIKNLGFGTTDCGTNGLLLVVFNNETKSPYQLAPINLCGQRPNIVTFFSNADLVNNRLVGWLQSVPTNDFVLVFNKGKVTNEAWQAVKPYLNLIGANPANFATLQEGHPYILLGQKGSSRALVEIISNKIAVQRNDNIQMEFEMGGGFSKGTLTSSRIGPARAWQKAFQKIDFLEKPSTDFSHIDVIGEDLQGVRKLLYTNLQNNTDLLNIEANQFPYLYLKFFTQDSINYTPSQIKKWLITYQGVPEGTINVEKVGAEAYKIPDKQEGELIDLEVVFENISQQSYLKDSLVVEYIVVNKKSSVQEKKTLSIKAPAPGQSTPFKLRLDTRDKGGANTLRVFVNPKVEPEEYFDNNILEVNYNVIEDEHNSLLDVTFDGRKILNGEIVSARPLIHIRFRDENKFLIKEDTTNLEISIKGSCEECRFQRINFSNPAVRWTSQEGNVDIEFQPENKLPDGIYRLRVQGSDAKGNRASTEGYEISFEVINESSITNFLPYPNPFSGSTRFVFTLTGAEVPQEIKIQIMTVTGKVVREITQAELGPIHVGNNLTQFAWNGTDEFGDKLANGVYLYRVLMRLNGQEIKHRATAADKAFKKDYGKLYILR